MLFQLQELLRIHPYGLLSLEKKQLDLTLGPLGKLTSFVDSTIVFILTEHTEGMFNCIGRYLKKQKSRIQYLSYTLQSAAKLYLCFRKHIVLQYLYSKWTQATLQIQRSASNHLVSEATDNHISVSFINHMFMILYIRSKSFYSWKFVRTLQFVNWNLLVQLQELLFLKFSLLLELLCYYRLWPMINA